MTRPASTTRTTTPYIPPLTATAGSLPLSSTPLHALLLLADSALPLGAFAFSSGLESWLAHRRHFPPSITNTTTINNTTTAAAAAAATTPIASPPAAGPPAPPQQSGPPPLHAFLHASLATQARSALPFLLAAHANPAALAACDDACDATTTCPVGRRQSVEQGRALLAVWRRGLSLAGDSSEDADGDAAAAAAAAARDALRGLEVGLRAEAIAAATKPATATSTTHAFAAGVDDDNDGDDEDAAPPSVHGHVAPVFGAVARALGLPAEAAAYVFLLGHARLVLGAAVRAGVLGPFRQQAVLAGGEVQEWLAAGVATGERAWKAAGVMGAGQVVPLMDVWAGRHEVLYTRIFNS